MLTIKKVMMRGEPDREEKGEKRTTLYTSPLFPRTPVFFFFFFFFLESITFSLFFLPWRPLSLITHNNNTVVIKRPHNSDSSLSHTLSRASWRTIISDFHDSSGLGSCRFSIDRSAYIVSCIHFHQDPRDVVKHKSRKAMKR